MRKRSDTQKNASASSDYFSEYKGAGGEGMIAAGPLKCRGREQRSKWGVQAMASPHSARRGPYFAAVAASAGISRSPPCAATAGGIHGRGVEE